MRHITAGAAAIAALGWLCSAEAQAPPPEAQAPAPAAAPAPLLTPQQLDDLVAPIALYPDPLLGQALAASTYPIEIVEAYQWTQDHRNWKPSKLMDEAKKQKWDPSVQALVAFPDALARLAGDISWTTPLGNAFLAQQADVMAAVQRMRAKAEADGKLQSNAQETVTTQVQNGQSAIDIEPANPEVIYVPVYNPAYVWGPPVYGYYPPLLYPGIDAGFDWGPGINLDLSFGGWWGGWGWGGWGWTPNWYGGGIFVNHSFFHRGGFRDYYGRDAYGESQWVHDPVHRLGVPYANSAVAARFANHQGNFNQGGFNGGGANRGGFNGAELNRGNFNAAGVNRGFAGNERAVTRQPAQRFGSSGFEQRSWTGNRSVFGGYHNGLATRMQSDRGFGTMGANRGFGGFRGGGGGFGGARGGGRR